ncbi:MAG: glycosyltransferase family 4 protein [Pseudomonadota bacterium]
MNLLFIHPNMPGQYKHLARAFGAEGGHRIFFITKHKTAEIPGVTRITYGMGKEPAPQTHRYLLGTARAVLQGQQVWRVCHALRTRENFTPDVVIAHPGWGDMLFIKEIFPNAKVLSFFEFYYQAKGADVGFGEAVNDDDLARIRMKNVTNLMSLEQADWGVSPTVWQWSLNPPAYQPKISVLHDGVDVERCVPDAAANFTLPNGKILRPGDEVVTYIARNFEPYRGFPTFMNAAEILLRARPNLHIIAIGADEVSYGRKAPPGTSYREMLMKEVALDLSRIHFIGTVPYDQLLAAFQVSAAHLYLTFPFVLSWSMLEAMACGVALVASNTKPVLEVVEDGVNGLLVDFFSPEDVAAKVMQVLDDPTRNQAMRAQARATVVDRFALTTLLPLHMQLVRDLAAGKLPTETAEKIKAVSPIAPYARALWSGE